METIIKELLVESCCMFCWLARGGGARSRSDGQSPVCQCGDDARLMTVRKEGPNTGTPYQMSSCSCF